MKTKKDIFDLIIMIAEDEINVKQFICKETQRDSIAKDIVTNLFLYRDKLNDKELKIFYMILDFLAREEKVTIFCRYWNEHLYYIGIKEKDILNLKNYESVEFNSVDIYSDVREK